MSIFANIGNAKMARSDDRWFKAGVYLCTVLDVKQRVSTHPTRVGETRVIIEFRIDEATGENKEGDLVETHILMKWGDKAEQMIKAFLMAAAKITPAQALEISNSDWMVFAEKACYHIGDEVEGLDVSEWQEQPLKGAQLTIRAEVEKTKNGGNFTKLHYSVA